MKAPELEFAKEYGLTDFLKATACILLQLLDLDCILSFSGAPPGSASRSSEFLHSSW